MARKCDSCGARVRKGAQLCDDCAGEALEVAQERYYLRGAVTYGEHLDELRRINSLAGWKRRRR